MPDRWDRYYQVNVDIDPIVETPGLPDLSRGDSWGLAGQLFEQKADSGFFLVSEEPYFADDVSVLATTLGGRHQLSEGVESASIVESWVASRSGTHAHVRGEVRGSRVVGSDLRIHFGRAGGVAVTGRPIGDLPGRDPGPQPPLEPSGALETVVERFDLDQRPKTWYVEEVVFPVGEGGIWAYEVGLVIPEDSADVRVYLSADDHALLLSHNVASASSGKALAFEINPMRSSPAIEVPLEGLGGNGDLLRSSRLDVQPGQGTRLQSSTGDFRVEPVEPGFDEGHGYYHLSRALSYFTGLLGPAPFTGKPFTPLRTYVNDRREPGNASYNPLAGELQFGVFEGRSMIRCATIVYHEFTHAVTDAISKLGHGAVKDAPSRGLSEGYSDYFAAAMLDSPIFGDYVTDNPAGVRDCSDPSTRFPENYEGMEHVTGAAWAAVLWGIRQGMDQRQADLLVGESLYFVDATSNFDDGKAALRMADDALFEGSNRDLIENEFDRRRPD